MEVTSACRQLVLNASRDLWEVGCSDPELSYLRNEETEVFLPQLHPSLDGQGGGVSSQHGAEQTPPWKVWGRVRWDATLEETPHPLPVPSAHPLPKQ